MRNLKKNNSNSGFTLIELLVVASILVVITTAVYSAFSNTLKIWQRLKDFSYGYTVNIACDKFSRDISNLVYSNLDELRFKGNQQSLSIPSLLRSVPLNKITPGNVLYAYDAQNKVLQRAELDYSQVYNKQRPVFRDLLKNVLSCKFLFYEYNNEAKEYNWISSWPVESKELPQAVRVEIEVQVGKNKQTITRTFNICAYNHNAQAS